MEQKINDVWVNLEGMSDEALNTLEEQAQERIIKAKEDLSQIEGEIASRQMGSTAITYGVGWPE